MFPVYYFSLTEFAPDGSLVQVIEEIGTPEEMTAAIQSAQSDSTLIILKRYLTNGMYNDISAFQESIETALSIPADSLTLANIAYKNDAYIFMVDMADPAGSFQEAVDPWGGEEDLDGVQTDTLHMEKDDMDIWAWTSLRLNRKGQSDIFIEIRSVDFYNREIVLQDEIEGQWEVGDRFVVASTDFDWEEAEVFEAVSITGNTIQFEAEVLHTHVAESYHGVDMFAEVGLLTRRVKIHGEMEDECYDEEINNCEKFPFDNYGGHTKAIYGFTSYNVENAEIYHMGQATILGKYPLHFHMCEDTVRDGKQQILHSNSIHNTFARCTTIHGSHNVSVKDNVAYDHIGHCYFLEDGGEKDTLFEHNLGIGSRRGVLIPSDDRPTTFWITSPLTTLIDNVAAGSDNARGVGFWYLFPDKPVGPSEGMFFGNREAKRTPISEFRDNTAHSNGDIGLGLFNRLGESHEIIGCSTYSPRVDPMDSKSNYDPVVFDGYIGYKNKKFNAQLRATALEAYRFKVADSLHGIRLFRNMLGGYQRISDSIIVGESGNIGDGDDIMKIWNNDTEKWQWVRAHRSLPNPSNPYQTISGVNIRAEGPSHLDNIEFYGFERNDYREGAAIQWADDYPFHNGATTSSQGLHFDFAEDEALRMLDMNEKVGKNDAGITMRDLDGTLTGVSGVTMVPETAYYAESDTCTSMEGSNMKYCEEYYAKFFVSPSVSIANATFMSDAATGQLVHNYDTPESRISYTVAPGSDLYVLNWYVTMPKDFRIIMTGLDYHSSVIVGACVPANLTENILSNVIQTETGTPMKVACSLENLQEANDRSLFYDEENNIIYRKFNETRERADGDFGDCAGGLQDGTRGCQYLRIDMGSVLDFVDLNDGDCR